MSMGPKPRPLLSRWLERVLVGEDCWPWLGSTKGTGYGNIQVAPSIEEGAHRVAYRLFVGPIKPGMEVCHTCDNPACVKPSHLFLGTHAENVADMLAKGRSRHPRGVDNGAVLTESDVQTIRVLVRQGQSQRQIAAQFAVSRGCVRNIIDGKTWSWLPEMMATRELPAGSP